MKTKKLYRYRPLSDFLFKELRYDELYLASYAELNDPLDLSAKINFKPSGKKQLEYLIHFLIKTSLNLSVNINSGTGKSYIQKMIKLSKDTKLRSRICGRLYDYITKQKCDFVLYDSIEENVIKVSEEFHVEFMLTNFREEVQRITEVFFKNSYATCFSDTCSDFLMWSHYASKHTGICIEFSLNHKDEFPYFLLGKKNTDEEKYCKKFSEWEFNGILYWEKIHKIKYQKNIPSINFFDFSPVFENEGDCDLMTISKSRWHRYAHEVAKVFSVKTSLWKYEKEWRALDINFGKIKEPEERIRHYPIEAVTGVYFGNRTPNKIKDRIFKILNPKNEFINYFDCLFLNNRDVKFRKWEYVDD